MNDHAKMETREMNTNNVTLGDVTHTRDLLWKLDSYIAEEFRKQKISEKLSVDELHFHWNHANINIGEYDKHYGVPMDLKELQEYYNSGRYIGTEIGDYTIYSKENAGAAAADLEVTGMLIQNVRYYIRPVNKTTTALSADQQTAVLELFTKFFTMGASDVKEMSTIKELLASDTLVLVRKGLKALFTTVWKHLPDVSYLKERFAKGKIDDLQGVMAYITEITGCKRETPDINRFYSLYNSIPKLKKAGVSGSSLMTCLREEIGPFCKRHASPLDLGEIDREKEFFQGDDKFGLAMNFMMFCQVFGKEKSPTEFLKTMEKLGLRLGKLTDNLEIEDIMIKENKKIIYREWLDQKAGGGQAANFKVGTWNKCYAENRDDPAEGYIMKEKLKKAHTYNQLEATKSGDTSEEEWLIENDDTDEVEICAFRDIKKKLREGKRFTRGPIKRKFGGKPQRNRQSSNRQIATKKWVDKTQRQRNGRIGFNRPNMNRPQRPRNQKSGFNRGRMIFRQARNKKPKHRNPKTNKMFFTQEEFEATLNQLEDEVLALLGDINEGEDDDEKTQAVEIEALLEDLEDASLNEGKINNVNSLRSETQEFDLKSFKSDNNTGFQTVSRATTKNEEFKVLDEKSRVSQAKSDAEIQENFDLLTKTSNKKSAFNNGMKVTILQENAVEKTFRFILDSGASTTLVTAGLVECLKPDVKIRKLDIPPRASGAAGGQVKLEPIVVGFRLRCKSAKGWFMVEFADCLVTPSGPQEVVLMGRKDLIRNGWNVKCDKNGGIVMTLKGHKVEHTVQAEVKTMQELYNLTEISSNVQGMKNCTNNRIKQMPDAQYAWARKIEQKKQELKNTFTIGDIKIDPAGDLKALGRQEDDQLKLEIISIANKYKKVFRGDTGVVNDERYIVHGTFDDKFTTKKVPNYTSKLDKEIREAVNNQILELAANDVIRPVTPDMDIKNIIPHFVVAKRNGDHEMVLTADTARMVIDCARNLNNSSNFAPTQADNTESILWHVARASKNGYIGSADISSMFHCFRLHESCQPYFCIESEIMGRFVYTRTPMGWIQSPAITREFLMRILFDLELSLIHI